MFAFKLSLYIVMCVVAIFLFVLVYNYRAGQAAIMENIKDHCRYSATATINEINTYLNTAQQIPEDISNVLESCDLSQEQIIRLLKTEVENCEEIYGGTVAFEPYTFGENKYFFGPHFYKSNGKVKLGDEKHNYLKLDWYTIPKKLNKGVWIDPYFNEGNDTLMTTYVEPFYKTINDKRKFCGVVSCDIDLSWLKKLVSSIRIFDAGYAFILSPKGTYIEHKKNIKKNIFSLADKRGDANLKEIGKKMINHQTGFEEYYSYSLGKTCLVFYAPLKETGWSIGVVIPKDEAFSDLRSVTWNLFTIGTIGYTSILVLIIILILGFSWISNHREREKPKSL